MSSLGELVVTALGSGGTVGLIAWGRERWRTQQPHVVEQASLAVVAAARDELAEDNARLREQLQEERRRQDDERAGWSAERTRLITEIDSLWSQVEDLRRRVHSLPDPAHPPEGTPS